MSGRFLTHFHGELLPCRRMSWRLWLRAVREARFAIAWRYVGHQRRRWRLTENLLYLTSTGETVIVPMGVVVDFASIPCLCWRVIGPPTGCYAEAAAVHDDQWRKTVEQYRLGRVVGFARSNWLFLDGMAALGVARWRRLAMWAAVSLNGVRVGLYWMIRVSRKG